MLEPPLLGAGNRVYPFLICSHRSADSTVHLWDVLPTSEDGTDAMEAKPGAVLSHSVPADGENIITSIAWNVRMSFFHSLERRNIAGDRLLRRRSEVLERGILVRPHRVSPEIPGFQLLVTGSLPSFYVYHIGSEGVSQVGVFSLGNFQEFDTLAINDAEKQLGSGTSLRSNRRRDFMSTRSGSSGERVARRRQFLLRGQPESYRECESTSDESTTPPADPAGPRGRAERGVSHRER